MLCTDETQCDVCEKDFKYNVNTNKCECELGFYF